jgi:cytochrome c-type biogenesis protein
MLATLPLAFLAGLLSTLSPCVLPILPIVLAGAAAAGPSGAFALAAGLALSFTAIGLFVATVGFSIGIDIGAFRTVAGVLLIAVGALLLLPALRGHVSAALGPLGDRLNTLFGTTGRSGPFAMGLVLGAVWTPCVGPTLGAASLLAAKGENLGEVALTMFAFGIGAGLPLLLLGFVSQKTRRQLGEASRKLDKVLGAGLIVAGMLVLTGADKWLETRLLDISPDWLTRLTTAI